MFIDDFTLDGKEEPPDRLLLSNHNEELKYLNAKKLLCCLRCCVKRKNKNRKTEAEEKLPTLPFEYHFALGMLGTKVKFHDLLPVLTRKTKVHNNVYCVAFSLQLRLSSVYSDTYKPD